MLLGLAVWLTLSPGVLGARIVAVGDVHGDLENLTAVLQRADVIDASGQWSGSADVFVQTGDLLDRGVWDRAVLDLMMRLQEEAPRAGGEVVALLGNHEVMNLLGDLRYVNPEAYRSFADSKSEQRRKKAWRQYLRFQQRQAKRYQLPLEEISQSESEWLESHPLGYLEHREAFSPQGRYGRWLRKQPVLAKVGDTLFVHGGVTEELPDTLDGVNQRVANEIRQFDALKEYLEKQRIILGFFDSKESFQAVRRELDFQRSTLPAQSQFDQTAQRHIEYLEGFLASERWLFNHPLGPLWNRALAQEPETPESLERVESLLQRYGASRVVIGHTPNLEGISQRFGGRVVLIDTGMLESAYPGGTPSALEIDRDRIRTIYLQESKPIQ